jgi:hypothetical protein
MAGRPLLYQVQWNNRPPPQPPTPFPFLIQWGSSSSCRSPRCPVRSAWQIVLSSPVVVWAHTAWSAALFPQARWLPLELCTVGVPGGCALPSGCRVRLGYAGVWISFSRHSSNWWVVKNFTRQVRKQLAQYI